jgi:hypothetical protein
MVSFSQFRLQIALIAQFSDYVAVAITGKYLKTAQNIRMVQLFEHIYL